MTSPLDDPRLKQELVGLFAHMNRMRRELAELQAPVDGETNFASMADTLDAIVENTEIASNTILESMEGIEGVVAQLRTMNDPKVAKYCDQIEDRISGVFEACSFQDLTGQRITRVVRSLKFIEERVNAMVRVWGKDALMEAIDEVKKTAKTKEDMDKALLHGPQRVGAAISQDDVDKLFSQDDIDKLFG